MTGSAPSWTAVAGAATTLAAAAGALAADPAPPAPDVEPSRSARVAARASASLAGIAALAAQDAGGADSLAMRRARIADAASALASAKGDDARARRLDLRELVDRSREAIARNGGTSPPALDGRSATKAVTDAAGIAQTELENLQAASGPRALAALRAASTSAHTALSFARRVDDVVDPEWNRKTAQLASAAQALDRLDVLRASLAQLLPVAARSAAVREWYPVDPEMNPIRTSGVVPAAMTPDPPQSEPAEEKPEDTSFDVLVKRWIAAHTK